MGGSVVNAAPDSIMGYFKELDIMIKNHENADLFMNGKWNAMRILQGLRWDLIYPVDNNRYLMICRMSDRLLTVNNYTQER